jgi:hypothetical protein
MSFRLMNAGATY